MEPNDNEKVIKEVVRRFNESKDKSPEAVEENNRMIDKALEAAIRQGRSKELREIFKAHPHSMVIIDKEGDLIVQAVVGKRLARRAEVVFRLVDERRSFVSKVKWDHFVALLFLTNQKEIDDSIMFDTNMNGRDILALNNEKFEIDSKLYLAARTLSQCEVILSDDSSLDDKLYAAHELGVLSTRFSTLTEEGRTQAKIAKQQRKSTLNSIIKKMAKRDGTAKELWLVFFGELDDNGLSPIECTKELKYFYKNPDGKDQSIKFKTFENKLSALRKDNLSK